MTRLARRPFGSTDDGQAVEAFTLSDGPVEVTVLGYGVRLQSVLVPDRDGVPGEVVLGYDDLAGYLADEAYHGAVVGRFGNRIAGGRFTLDGREHVLPQNFGTSTLHGGPDGFHRRVWAGEEVDGGVRFTLRSPDGDQGFPGTLDAAVTVTLRGTTLRLDYEAAAEAPTVVNLTNHSYLNLRGVGLGPVEDHEVTLTASRYLAVDEDFIPLPGDPADVEGTPLDFRGGFHRLGERLREGHEQLVRAGGYDHCLLLDAPSLTGAAPGDDDAGTAPAAVGVAPAAVVREPTTGRTLTLRTDQPGVQLYSGNMLPGNVGRGGRMMRQGDGLCLETQHLPDSPNRPDYPSTVLRPGERYATSTSFTFGTY